MSPCTEIPDLNTLVIKGFPVFNYNVIVLKARTGVLKAQTKLRPKIVRGLNAKMATMGGRL
jgi:hypothetical protein